MSPVADPHRARHRQEARDREQAMAAYDARAEFIRPLVLLVIGATGTMLAMDAAVPVYLYPIVLAIEVTVGVIGLWIAAQLFLGGAGPFGLAVLRLAGIYAFVDLIGALATPLLFFAWFVKGGVYLGLLCWLFELELGESVVLAVITWILKIGTGLAILSLLAGM